MTETKSKDVEKTDIAQKSTPIFEPDKRIKIEENDRIDETKKPEQQYDPDKRIQPLSDTSSFSERTEKKQEVKGGSYSEVKKNTNSETHEVHHMPADATSKLSHGDGPAIRMEKADHRKTASCGYSKEAQEYRAAQKKLIEEGKFREALQMDIDDIHDKFGDKYDDAIAEMLDYVEQLESEGRI